MAIFENAVRNNPPEGECISGITENEEEEDNEEEADDVDEQFSLSIESNDKS